MAATRPDAWPGDPVADPRWTAVGPAGAPLVVLIHPTRLSRAFWAPQLEALAPSHRVLAVDLPGHGRLADEHFTLPAAVALVRAAIEAEVAPSTGCVPAAVAGSASRPAPTVIVGLSLGGYVAMALAAETPSLVDTLVVAGATAEPTGPRAHPFRLLALALDRGRSARFDRLSASVIRRRYPGELGEQIAAAGFARHGGAEALRSLAGESFLERIAAFPGSVVLVNGQRDLAMRPGEQRFLAATRRGRLVHLPGAFHLSSLDRPGAFTAIVRSAVDEAVRARQSA
jgi:pimeloyl-ACP methyl ester carboxylesterase